MKKLKIYIGALMVIALASCSQDAPFSFSTNGGTGRVLTSSLSMEVKAATPTSRGLTNGIPDKEDFIVGFYQVTDENNAVKTYESYGSMPEIVELPAGNYFVKVTYGGTYGNEGANAAFNSPYYEGRSGEFKVEVDKITDNIETVVCYLSNIRVKVKFGEALVNAMSKDSKVDVYVGRNGTTLPFTLTTTEDGFFEAEGSPTLAATFNGTVEGERVSVTKTIDNVKSGNYYIITFNLQKADAADPGNIIPGEQGDFVIDASVTLKDLNQDPNYNDDANPWGDQDEYLEDDKRPENGDIPGQGGEDPGEKDPDGEDPGNTPGGNPGGNTDNPPVPEEGQITITCSDPLNEDLSGQTIVTEQKVDDGMNCVLYVNSVKGIEVFTVEITSSDPNFKSAIDEFFGEDGINLITDDGKDWDYLDTLNIPYDVRGENSVDFDITGFLSLLVNFPGEHRFTVTVGDGSEPVQKTLTLKVINE